MDLEPVVDQRVLARAPELHDAFVSATPFPHAIVEGFFDELTAHQLVAEFPSFEARYAVNELGAVGRKAVVPGIAHLGPAYRRVEEYFSSTAFLQWLSSVTGIPALRYDAENFGGGTHENLDGQDLLPHVDFNYHPTTGYHRRLNLIVYLNEGWNEAWGGSITVHSNPRDPARDETKSYAPLFNRCIIFETSERSWHSFDAVALPAHERHRSRKSLSIYFYTRERPAEHTQGEHPTFYVPRPLPDTFVAGRTLSHDDVVVLHKLLEQRDRLLEQHQEREARRTPETVELSRLRILVPELMSRLRVPLEGYVLAEGPTSGWYPDGWTTGDLKFTVRADRPVTAFTLNGMMPDGVPPGTTVAVTVHGSQLASAAPRPGPFALRVPAALDVGSTADIRVLTSAVVNYKKRGLGDDERDLGVNLHSIVFEHRRS